MSHYKCTVQQCSPMHIYMCTLSVPYTRTKAYFVKLKIGIWQNLVSFNISRCALFCEAITGSLTGRQFLCLSVYSESRMRQIVQPSNARSQMDHLATAVTVHGCIYAFFVLIPGITMYQYKCTVHSVFSYGHLYVIFQPPSHKNKGLIEKNE